ncbi:hypothetical protein BCR34DRAFT_608670 [Clohesyomyces aquaticus]|uniref:Uncharacterized protein n=1 Tax=Clohesyomyces aquaticus TaxID=1231657 RepID=A0A1Y1Y4N1_9PLEO|nr:hypothetical protein BCR34DRAFT_608670 [Clohesyomyces aquaticus]
MPSSPQHIHQTMVDVAVSAQLQQWTFEKPSIVGHPERSDSSASSPDLYNQHDNETLRIDAAAVDRESISLDTTKETIFQERYLSSEEDLSPMDHSDSDLDDDDVSIHDGDKENCFSARKMSISRFDKGKSCDLAVTVSYMSAGRPKVIEMPTVGSPMRDTPQRSASLPLNQLPIAAINKLRQVEAASRLSLNTTTSSSRTRSPSPANRSRRPSTSHLPFSNSSSKLNISDSSSSFRASSSRSSSPAMSNNSRPPSAMAFSNPAPRSSLYLTSTARNSPLVPFPPLTPSSPGPHAFLSSDPYETSTTSAGSPIIKSGPHKRLRSISQKLSLAKIAIIPSKKWDSRINGKSANMPQTPGTPYTPLTPMTAPPTNSSSVFSSPKNRLRRNSRASRPTSRIGLPSSEVPPLPTSTTWNGPQALPATKRESARLVPRGANEREPTLELPPFPAGGEREQYPSEEMSMSSIKAKRVRKRKSLMDFTKDLMTPTGPLQGAPYRRKREVGEVSMFMPFHVRVARADAE